MSKTDFISVSRNTILAVFVSMGGWMVFTDITRTFNLDAIKFPFLALLGLFISFLVVKFGWKK